MYHGQCWVSHLAGVQSRNAVIEGGNSDYRDHNPSSLVLARLEQHRKTLCLEHNSSATHIPFRWGDTTLWNQLKSLCSPQITSNTFCNKTVLNRFSSYSLKPRCIIGLSLVTFLLIAIIPSIPHLLWWYLHRPELMSAQPTTILMRLGIFVAIAVYSSLKDRENLIRPDL